MLLQNGLYFAQKFKSGPIVLSTKAKLFKEAMFFVIIFTYQM